MTAVVEAVGVASLHAIVKAPWLLVSALIGVTGIILLIRFARSNRYDSTIASDGDANPAHGSDPPKENVEISGLGHANRNGEMLLRR
jgi:hypothetical protein